MYYTVNPFSITNYCLQNELYHFAFYLGIYLARITKVTNNVTLGGLCDHCIFTEVVYKYTTK